MKKILLGALALSLAACNAPLSPTDPQVTSAVAEVQTTAETLCGFVPAATTIVALFSANPGVTSAFQVANIVCGVVTKKGANHWEYRGVRIKGHFTRKG